MIFKRSEKAKSKRDAGLDAAPLETSAVEISHWSPALQNINETAQTVG
jgi:hypothetical protein